MCFIKAHCSPSSVKKEPSSGRSAVSTQPAMLSLAFSHLLNIVSYVQAAGGPENSSSHKLSVRAAPKKIHLKRESTSLPARRCLQESLSSLTLGPLACPEGHLSALKSHTASPLQRTTLTQAAWLPTKGCHTPRSRSLALTPGCWARRVVQLAPGSGATGGSQKASGRLPHLPASEA